MTWIAPSLAVVFTASENMIRSLGQDTTNSQFSCQHAQAGALAQEHIHDDQVPVLRVGLQPLAGSGFAVGHAHGLHGGQLLQRADQVLADGGVVFDEEGAELHSGLSGCGEPTLS